MLLLILALCIITIILGYIFIPDEEVASGLAVLLIICCCIDVIAILIVGGSYINDSQTINPKITMYQQENQTIEEKMDVLVKEYMKFEKDTFEDCKGESSITLISLYPKLKSDKLVKQQLDIYIKNNNKIKKLKETKINLKPSKWWLYFG